MIMMPLRKWDKTTQFTMPGQGEESLVEFVETGAVSAWFASVGDKQVAFECYSYNQYEKLGRFKERRAIRELLTYSIMIRERKHKYVSNTAVCMNCPLLEQCIKS